MQTERESVATAGTMPVLDRAYLARFTLGNRALELEVLGLFSVQAPLYVSRLQAATSDKEWKEAAHTLKGSAGAIGAVQVAKLAEQVERLVPQPHGDKRENAIASLTAAVDTVRAAIAELAA